MPNSSKPSDIIKTGDKMIHGVDECEVVAVKGYQAWVIYGLTGASVIVHRSDLKPRKTIREIAVDEMVVSVRPPSPGTPCNTNVQHVCNELYHSGYRCISQQDIDHLERVHSDLYNLGVREIDYMVRLKETIDRLK